VHDREADACSASGHAATAQGTDTETVNKAGAFRDARYRGKSVAVLHLFYLACVYAERVLF